MKRAIIATLALVALTVGYTDVSFAESNAEPKDCRDLPSHDERMRCYEGVNEAAERVVANAEQTRKAEEVAVRRPAAATETLGNPSANGDKYGSLAIDHNQGELYGWAVNGDTQDEADGGALEECEKTGGQCTVVLRFRNACAAYSADQAAGSTATGWAWTEKDRETAETMARGECEKRGGTNCTIRAWGCTDRPAATTATETVAQDAGDVESIMDSICKSIAGMGPGVRRWGDEDKCRSHLLACDSNQGLIPESAHSHLIHLAETNITTCRDHANQIF